MATVGRTVILGVALLGGLTGCGHTIRPGETGLKYKALKQPALQSKELDDGFYFQWWWNDIVTYDRTWQSADLEVEVLTADDLHVPVSLTITFRPEAGRLLELHNTIGPAYYDEVIKPMVVTLVRDEFANYAHNDLARESLVMETAILEQAQERLVGKPLEIDAVTVSHIRFDSSVTASISKKLVMEQQAEEKDFEIEVARREAEIARTVARGQADAERILAEGEGAALVIKGKAQAEAQDAIADTLTREYLQYKAFDGKNTTYYFAPIGRDGLPVIIRP